jgi:hypothetical protein
MAKIFSKFLITIVVFIYYVTANANNDSILDGLDYRQRPIELQNKIDELFAKIAEKNESKWMFNGPINNGGRYCICGITDEKLVFDIILNAPPEQKDFYFIDVGAGQYQWVDNIHRFLSNNPQIPRDKNYHIIGLNGEGKDKIEYDKNFTLYRLGGFKIENAIEAFEKRGLYLKGKVDLTVTHMTFLHLIDPLGTFLQLYKLTNLNGYILVGGGMRLFIADPTTQEGIYGNYGYNDDYYKGNLYVEHMLKELKQTYLMGSFGTSGSDSQFRDFVVQKRDMNESVLTSWSYVGLKDNGASLEQEKGRYQVLFSDKNSMRLHYIINDYPQKGKDHKYWYNTNSYHGNKELYDMLKKKDYICPYQPPMLDYDGMPFVPDLIVYEEKKQEVNEAATCDVL